MLEPTLHYPRAAFLRVSCPRDPYRSRKQSPNSHRFVRNGGYRRKSDRKRVQGYLCRTCGYAFVDPRFKPCFRQKKRQLNFEIWRLLASKVDERRIARLLGIDRRTVARKKRYLECQARLWQREFLRDLASFPELRRQKVQLDEMESFEHSRCKPLSLPLLVDTPTRLILGIDVCVMPAHGKLAEISRRKYGPRPNHRMPTISRLLRSARPVLDPKELTIRSDSHPYYPPLIRSHYPYAKHEQEEGRRAAIVGQGELKRGGWDPLFSLNHTAAMIRGNVARLVRKTWCTTKKRARLKGHLMLYTVWHNQTILERLRERSGASSSSLPLLLSPLHQKTGPPV